LLDGGALLISDSITNVVDKAAGGALSDGLSTRANISVAAGSIAAALVLSDAGHAVTANLEGGVNANAVAALEVVVSGANATSIHNNVGEHARLGGKPGEIREVGVDRARRCLNGSGPELLAANVREGLTIGTASAILIDLAGAGDVRGLKSVNGAALEGARVVDVTGVAALVPGSVVALACDCERVELGVLGQQAAVGLRSGAPVGTPSYALASADSIGKLD
jgi:hypothetical protein